MRYTWSAWTARAPLRDGVDGLARFSGDAGRAMNHTVVLCGAKRQLLRRWLRRPVRRRRRTWASTRACREAATLANHGKSNGWELSEAPTASRSIESPRATSGQRRDHLRHGRGHLVLHLVESRLAYVDAVFADGGTRLAAVSGASNGLVTGFDTSGTMLWSTYLGGNGSDYATSVPAQAVSVHVTGVTNSELWPLAQAGLPSIRRRIGRLRRTVRHPPTSGSSSLASKYHRVES